MQEEAPPSKMRVPGDPAPGKFMQRNPVIRIRCGVFGCFALFSLSVSLESRVSFSTASFPSRVVSLSRCKGQGTFCFSSDHNILTVLAFPSNHNLYMI